jgi:hypothetical protein
MEDEDRVLKFRNDLEDLILSTTGRAPDKVARLARKAGIKDPPDNNDVGSCATNIVHEKARSPKVLLNLLDYLPNVCDDLEKKDIDELNRLIKELKLLFPMVHQVAADGSPGSGNPVGETEALFEAAIDLVRRTKDLRLKFQPLRSGQELTLVDVAEINNQLSESASDIAELLQAYPIESKPSISARRLLASLSRIEDEIFRCFDSLWYYAQVHSILEASRRADTGIGVAEADRAAAEMLRLRELNHARSQVRFRLSRVSEECELFAVQ